MVVVVQKRVTPGLHAELIGGWAGDWGSKNATILLLMLCDRFQSEREMQRTTDFEEKENL